MAKKCPARQVGLAGGDMKEKVLAVPATSLLGESPAGWRSRLLWLPGLRLHDVPADHDEHFSVFGFARLVAQTPTKLLPVVLGPGIKRLDCSFEPGRSARPLHLP